MIAGSYELTKEEKELLEAGKEKNKFEKYNNKGTKGDHYNKETLIEIIEHGTWDKNPRPRYHDEYYNARDYDAINRSLVTADGEVIRLADNQEVHEFEDRKEIWTPAHTKSIPPKLFQYNRYEQLGENPLITTRYIPCRDSIAELFWIWVKGSNDLAEFDELLGLRPRYKNPVTGEVGKQDKVNKDLPGCRTWMSDEEVNQFILNNDLNDEEKKRIMIEKNFIHNWWLEWALLNPDGSYNLNENNHPHIGSCYGHTNSIYDQFHNLVEGIRKDPDGRRHILCLWQFEEFKNKHGLKPCAFLTQFMVRHAPDGIDYLDCTLYQRSSDYMTASAINQYQYMVLQYLVAAELGLKPGGFYWCNANAQIYDRHIPQAFEQLNRDVVDCNIETVIHNEGKSIYDMNPSDVEVKGYPMKLIKSKNPDQRFQIGI